MSSMTIAKTRNNLSAIVSSIERGDIAEHLIRNRDRVVAKIVPIEVVEADGRRIGIAKDDPAFRIDDELFDELDDDIAEAFGL